MSKEYDYLITLKKTDSKLFDYISQLMLLFALAFFIFSGINTEKNTALFYFLISFLLIITWIYVRLLRKDSVSFRLPLFIAVIGWLNHMGDHLLIAVLYMLAYVFEKQVKRPIEIGVDKEGVSFNNFRIKRHSWVLLNNIVIKDGLITIDYKNNKLFQKELESDVSPELEKEFNEFCSSQLMAHSL